MKTCDDYKKYVKEIDPEGKKSIEDVEILAEIVSAVIRKRNELGITQRDLAVLSGMSQSSVARIETFKTTPNIETLIKMMRPLGLKLTVTQSLNHSTKK